jgi:ankyrin repeat protein
MTTQIKTIVALVLFLFASKISFAGATEDLWKALKSANDKDALTAISAGADVNNVDANGTSPLSLAACFSGAEVVKALIDGKAAIDYVQPANGFTPLMNAANWGNTEAVKLLLAAGANVKLKSKLGLPVIAVATASSKLEIIKMIVDAGADPNEKYTVNAIELVPFNSLIGVYDQNEKVTNLAANKPFIEKAGLMYPERLVNAKPEDFSPLSEITKYFLEKGADPNLKVIGGWGCILSQAAELGKTGMVKALIEGKADVNNPAGVFDRTPLYFACNKGHADIVQLLIDAKANLNPLSLIYNSDTWYKITPLMAASLGGFNDCVEALCKAGADVNYLAVKVDHKGEYNAASGNMTTWKLTVRNTAVSLANDNGHPDTVVLLKKYGGLAPKDIKK